MNMTIWLLRLLPRHKVLRPHRVLHLGVADAHRHHVPPQLDIVPAHHATSIVEAGVVGEVLHAHVCARNQQCIEIHDSVVAAAAAAAVAAAAAAAAATTTAAAKHTPTASSPLAASLAVGRGRGLMQSFVCLAAGTFVHYHPLSWRCNG